MLRKLVIGLCLGFLAAILIFIAFSGQVNDGRMTTEQRRHRDKFLKESIEMLPPMKPIVGVPTGTASQAEEVLNPEELVLGVVINGQAKAYPLNMIDAPERKVINDTLGGEEILVTWCDICHTAAVFSREIGGHVDKFGCSGLLWNNTLVIYDVATGSFWNHLLGECVAGERQGTRLEPIPAVITTWRAWRESHPETIMLVTQRVSQVLKLDYYQSIGSPMVFGLRDGGEPIAWKFAYLRQHPVLEITEGGREAVVFYHEAEQTVRAFSRRLGDLVLTFSQNNGKVLDAETGTEWDPRIGRAISGPLSGEALQPLAGITAFAPAWDAYFPGHPIHDGTLSNDPGT
ncbi:MAG: DUF3179 domain-containing protein [Planctomycetaceae bacterium]|nr:DUF3179 domain-containing protein [Planctomycetaceae bacterium]